jgi:dTDP-glucose pyrophosphorylase
MSTTRAVVLARGLGTRMRAADPAVALTPDQQRAADAGLKAMIPVNGRPFLDYSLSALADAGLRDVALVVAPEHEEIRRYYAVDAPASRVTVDFVVQDEPLGTANALIAAEPWTGGSAFLVMNADNLYPVRALAALASLDEPGLPAFERDDLVRTGNIAADRIRTFALIDIDADGYLAEIVEKPGADLPPERGRCISMNCWRFDARIFSACRDVPASRRGEHEIPEAVALAMRRGVRFKAFPARGPVLDLSQRADAAEVARRLAGVSPRP